MKSTAHWQADFYKTQPDSYRRAWWRWAADQPNFIELYKLCDEKEPEIIKVRERWYAVRNVRANPRSAEHQADPEGRQDHPDMPVLRGQRGPAAEGKADTGGALCGGADAG